MLGILLAVRGGSKGILSSGVTFGQSRFSSNLPSIALSTLMSILGRKSLALHTKLPPPKTFLSANCCSLLFCSLCGHPFHVVGASPSYQPGTLNNPGAKQTDETPAPDAINREMLPPQSVFVRQCHPFYPQCCISILAVSVASYHKHDSLMMPTQQRTRDHKKIIPCPAMIASLFPPTVLYPHSNCVPLPFLTPQCSQADATYKKGLDKVSFVLKNALSLTSYHHYTLLYMLLL